MSRSMLKSTLIAVIGLGLEAYASGLSFVHLKAMEKVNSFPFPKEKKNSQRLREWKLNKQRAGQLSKRGISRPVARRQ